MTLRTFAAGLLVALSSLLLPSQPLSSLPLNSESTAVSIAPEADSKENVMTTEVKSAKFFVTNADHYTFDASSFTRLKFKVVIVYHKTFQELADAEGHPEAAGNLMAFTYPQRAPGVCEIHLMDPTVIWYPQYVGHELMHCIHGNFHPSR